MKSFPTKKKLSRVALARAAQGRNPSHPRRHLPQPSGSLAAAGAHYRKPRSRPGRRWPENHPEIELLLDATDGVMRFGREAMAGVLGTVNPASPEAGLAPTRLDQERATPIAEELTTTVASGIGGRSSSLRVDVRLRQWQSSRRQRPGGGAGRSDGGWPLLNSIEEIYCVT